MKENEILGYFSARDDINLNLSSNMYYNLGLPTLIHEASHKLLCSITTLGFVEFILSKEYEVSKDDCHKNHLIEILNLISKYSNSVHEIFANNLELLHMQSILNDDEAPQKLYQLKPSHYKEYVDKMSLITSDTGLTIDEKKQVILKMCAGALNIDICCDEFFDGLHDVEKLKQYLDSNDPLAVLNDNIINYAQKSKYTSTIRSIEESLLFLDKSTEKGIIHSAIDFVNFIKNIDFDELINHFEKLDFEFMHISNTKVYSFSNFQPLRVPSSRFKKESYDLVFLVKNFKIKGYKNIDGDYYLVAQNKQHKYISTIVSEKYINRLIKESKIYGLLIDGNEFLFEDHQHITFEVPENKPTFVILENYFMAEYALSQMLKKNKILLTTINDDRIGSIFSFIAFRLEDNPNIIFLFPTIKKIADKLIFKEDPNLKVLGAKNDEYLQVIPWILEFGMTLVFLFLSRNKWN
ncbi:hypothetical protein [Paenibacillus sp. FSL M7-0420]|uniref:hypothetical protein n=1 Tax=Paenibacillus sp. FSL M7-0420 TaxID=2921609 RepID=UPI0030F91A10